MFFLISSTNAKYPLIQMWGVAAFLCFMSLLPEYFWVWHHLVLWELLKNTNNHKVAGSEYQAENLPLPSSSGWPGPLPSTMAATSGTEMWNSIFLCPAGRGCSNTSEGCSAGALRTAETITTALNSSLHKVPTIKLAPERLTGWDILFWSTTDISQSADMQPGDTEVCVCVFIV